MKLEIRSITQENYIRLRDANHQEFEKYRFEIKIDNEWIPYNNKEVDAIQKKAVEENKDIIAYIAPLPKDLHVHRPLVYTKEEADEIYLSIKE